MWLGCISFNLTNILAISNVSRPLPPSSARRLAEWANRFNKMADPYDFFHREERQVAWRDWFSGQSPTVQPYLEQLSPPFCTMMAVMTRTSVPGRMSKQPCL